jgi:general secretion pathway protein D
MTVRRAIRNTLVALCGPWPVACGLAACLTMPARAQVRDTTTAKPAVATAPDSVSIRIVNIELRLAVQMLAQHLDRPVILSGSAGMPVTLETPRPVPKSSVLALLRGVLEGNGFELVADSTGELYRARPTQQGAPRGGGPFPPVRTAQYATTQASVELFVLSLRHARAEDVAETVNALFGRARAENGAARPTTLGDELRANQIPVAGAPSPQAVQGAAGRSAVLTGDVTIVSDARANSLLIRANREDFALIEAAVQQLDVRPLQVMIEVLIAEVRRNRSLRLGVEATLGPTAVGSTGATAEGTLTGPGLGDLVLKVMSVGGLNLDATLSAAAERGDVKVLSRPVVFATNNEPAEMVVGTQRPFIQLSRSLPTDAAVRDQIVQYKEVGTKLIVTPTISADGSVQLSVVQEVSGATNETAFNAPVISTRSVSTKLLVNDGQTIALGGLTDRLQESSQRGIPLLSSIPWIGGLFGGMSRATIETELFIFITPRVIRTAEDAAKLTEPMRQQSGRIER